MTDKQKQVLILIARLVSRIALYIVVTQTTGSNNVYQIAMLRNELDKIVSDGL